MSWPVKDLPSIKKEQVDTNEALRSPFSGKTSKSTDPIVVSSEESNLPSGIVEKPRYVRLLFLHPPYFNTH